MAAFSLFIIFVIGMWCFIIWNTYKKFKYRKRIQWVKAFTKLAENTPYIDIYDELKELSYEFKGTAQELICKSDLPDNEKKIALHYFNVNIGEKSNFLNSGKTFGRMVWGISIIILVLVYFCFLQRDIHSQRDAICATLILIVVNLIVQTICYFIKEILFLILKQNKNKQENIFLKYRGVKDQKRADNLLIRLYKYLDDLFS